MSIPANLEDRINDPISLEPFKEVQLTNCKHRFSLSSAQEVFGEMKEGSCTRPSPCPLCKQRVTKYESDPIFQDIIDQILISSKPVAKAPVVPQVPIIPTTSQLPNDVVKVTEKDRNTRSTSSQDMPLKFPIFDPFKEREKSSTDAMLSDEEIARALQEEFNREIQTPNSSQPQFPLGQSPGEVAIKPRVPQEKKIYNLNLNQNCHLPENSENCEINAGVNSKITIGDNGFNIIVNGATNSPIDAGKKCSNLFIKAPLNNNVTLGSHCNDCTISLGINSKATLGDNCSNIQVYLGLNASYKLGKNCKNILVNGGRVA